MTNVATDNIEGVGEREGESQKNLGRGSGA